MEIKSRKVTGDLVFMALDQMGDTSGGVTSEMISKKIRELTGHDVDNAYVEDFMLGISSRLTSYMNLLIMQGSSAMVAKVMGSVFLKNAAQKSIKRALKGMKKVTEYLPKKGKKATIFNKAMAFGSDNGSTEIAEVNATLKTLVVYNNASNAIQDSTAITNMSNFHMLQARAVDGDSKIPGEGSLLKAVLEFKATAKQGF